jgi:predicted metalloprotease with PDZ domain
MKKVIFSAILVLCINISAQKVYKYSLDLTSGKNKEITIRLIPPRLNSDTLIYQFPSVIPGSYMILNFGKYIKSFKAYDSNGKKLKVKYSKNDNSFTIIHALKLDKIEYVATETWDYDKIKNYVFQPSGTHFEMNKIYLLNTHALFGYFEGYDNINYEIEIHKGDKLYCTTSADIHSVTKTDDIVKAENFAELADNPLIYTIPDTISVKVKNCTFHISVVSRNNKVTSKEVLALVKPVLSKGLARFFDVFPSDDYYLFFYFAGWQDKNITKYGGLGAHEHRKSSIYFYNETLDVQNLNDFLTHVVCHEYLHVITPLSLRSEQIAYFNYKRPVMSKHLWLYEGLVEYFSNLILFRDSILSADDFILDLRKKIIHNNKYPNITMTDFSVNIFNNEKLDYLLVAYNRGALIAFLLDIRLNELSGGKYNLKKLISDLNSKYKGKFFKDDELFDEIAQKTYPEIKDFINLYISGNKELPIEEYLNKIGYSFYNEKEDSIFSFGNVRIGFSIRENKCLVFKTTSQYNAFGLNSKDQIISINDTVLDQNNYYKLIRYIEDPTDDRVVNVKYLNNGMEIDSKNRARKFSVTQMNYIEPEKSCDPAKIKLRKEVLDR